MKFLITFLVIFGLTTKSHSNNNELVIYTYDSFVSELGPGPIIESIFEEKYNKQIQFVSVDSAATLLTKVILEGSSTKADLVLGLDMNLINEAIDSNLFDNLTIDDIDAKLSLPIKWEYKNFVPYNYGYFAFVYNNKNFKNPPQSMDELINHTDAKIVIQDPRTSTPGLGLLTSIKSIYGKNAPREWSKLNKKIVSVTKGWSDSYYNIFLAGEADLVLSYTTSPAAHIMFEKNNDYTAISFEEGNYLTVEFAGVLKSSKNKESAMEFMNFILSEDFQSIIPLTNIMYPVIKVKNLPEAFNSLNITNKALQINPKTISNEKENWINEWLNAS